MPHNSTFLILNASVVWLIVTVILMKLCRLKSLVLVLIISPFVIGSTFQHIAGMPQLIGFYGTSILYGCFGIIGGITYVEYAKAKAYFKRASKTSFIARGAIALSSLYLLSFFVQKIIVQNPMVEFALSWIDGGEQATQIFNQFNYDGVVIAGFCIVISISVLAFNSYRERQFLKTQNHTQNHLDQL